MSEASTIAPKGTIWVCAACGKTAKDKYGCEGAWDESCMLHAVLCDEKKHFDEKTGMLEWWATGTYKESEPRP